MKYTIYFFIKGCIIDLKKNENPYIRSVKLFLTKKINSKQLEVVEKNIAC